MLDPAEMQSTPATETGGNAADVQAHDGLFKKEPSAGRKLAAAAEVPAPAPPLPPACASWVFPASLSPVLETPASSDFSW